MATTTDLSTLKINYLSQAQYDSAKSGGTLNANELYLTPASGGGGAGIFYAEYGTTTYSDVKDAYDAGMDIVCKYDTGDGSCFFYPLNYYSESTGNNDGEFWFFTAYHSSTFVIQIILYEDDSWDDASFQADYVPSSYDFARFDSNAKLNSTDMSSADVTSFVNGLNVSGQGVGWTRTLLWTNPSPNSPMTSQQVVASGADGYEEIEVVYKTAHAYNGWQTQKAPYVSGAHITLLAPSGSGGEFTGAVANAVRTISMSSGELTVGNAGIFQANGFETNNNMCIPVYIYGLNY